MADSGRGSSCSLWSKDSSDELHTGFGTSPWNTIVRPVLYEMCKVMSPRELVTNLYSKRLLSSEQLSSLRQMPDTDAAILLLTDILPRKGPEAYERFICVIEETEGQEFLVEQFDLRCRGVLPCDESAESGDSGNPLMSTVKNLETEKARLNERVVTLEETAAKAITKLKRKEIIEMGLRLQGGNDADMQVDEFVTSGVSPSWIKVAEPEGYYRKWTWDPPRPTNRLPFTVVQDRAIIARNEYSELTIVDVKSQEQYTRRLPEYLGRICGLVRCGDECYAATSQTRRLGIHRYIVSHDKWEYIDDIPGGHVFQTVTVTTCDNYLYIMGSMLIGQAFSVVLSFHSGSRRWKRLPDLQASVLSPSLAVVNNSLIVTGCVSSGTGSEGDGEFSVTLRRQMKCLFLAQEKWVDFAEAMEWNPQISVIHNLVVATGGISSSTTSLSVKPDCIPTATEQMSMRVLDPYTRQWLPLPFPVGRDPIAQHSACVTEHQTLMVLIQTYKDDNCQLYEMDIPCDMTSDMM